MALLCSPGFYPDLYCMSHFPVCTQLTIFNDFSAMTILDMVSLVLAHLQAQAERPVMTKTCRCAMEMLPDKGPAGIRTGKCLESHCFVND